MNTLLKIINYKCFENQDIILKKLTILAGANSSGKSSVVQSLLLLRVTVDKLQLNTQIILSESVESSGIAIPLNHVYKLALGTTQEILNRNVADDVIQFVLLEKGAFFQVSLYPAQEKTKLDLTNVDCEIRPFDALSISKNEFYYLNAERKGPRLRHDVGSLDFLHTGYEGEYAIQVFERLKDDIVDPSKLFDENESHRYSSQVPLWMNYITPGVDVSVPILYEKVRTAELGISGSSPTNVGFGVSYVLPIVLNGLLAKKGTMFIVENPEAHLHPAGQSRIGYFLAKVAAAGVQVIIETHSEHVINGIRIASLDEKVPILPNDILINFFSKDKISHKVTVQPIHITESGDLSKFPRDFFDQTLQDMGTIVKLKRQKK